MDRLHKLEQEHRQLTNGEIGPGKAYQLVHHAHKTAIDAYDRSRSAGFAPEPHSIVPDDTPAADAEPAARSRTRTGPACAVCGRHSPQTVDTDPPVSLCAKCFAQAVTRETHRIADLYRKRSNQIFSLPVQCVACGRQFRDGRDSSMGLCPDCIRQAIASGLVRSALA